MRWVGSSSLRSSSTPTSSPSMAPSSGQEGGIWHKASMERGVVPHHSIDTDARWGKSKTKGWVFGYKLHLSCSTGHLIVPLSADFTTANVPDNQKFGRITASLRGVRY